MPSFPFWFYVEELPGPLPPDTLGALTFAPLPATGFAFELVLASCPCCARTYGLWRDMLCRPWGDPFDAALA